jgi:hypothetical protein
MAIALDYKTMPEWPVLSWLAVCEPGIDRVLVLHGRDVQTRPDWFCEAVWDGVYSEANLDQTDLIYGSGARCRGDRITFVSSGATIDRLQFIERDAVLISNSLVCLLAISGTDPDPQFRGYIDLFSSIGRGYKRCDRFVPLGGGAAQLVYFQNLEWDGQTLREIPKVIPCRDFSSYEQYITFLSSSLQRLATNLSSPDRAFAYDWQGSISRGYDSPTAVALAKEVGLRTALSFHESRPGVRDDGGAIAETLGVELKLVDRLGCQKKDGIWEPLFLSGDGQGKEIMLSTAPALLRRRVLVTGNGGDYVWDMNPGSISTELAHDEYAGLSLTEFRLHCGFIHLPLPYMGMSQVADVCRISQSPEMSRWDIGGSYSRPICRRVLEERGVPRDVFGTHKTGASIRFVIGQDPWSSRGHKAFLNWILTTSVLSEHRWMRRAWLATVLTFLRLSLVLGPSAPRTFALVVNTVCRRIVRYLRRCGVEDYAFLWGIACIRQSYQGGDKFQFNMTPNSGTKKFLKEGGARSAVSALNPGGARP